MRGATRRRHAQDLRLIISIHAPHARSDDIDDLKEMWVNQFQSTLLMRGATCSAFVANSVAYNFNPRSSCEERPSYRQFRQSGYCYFNPRSSCEERR